MKNEVHAEGEKEVDKFILQAKPIVELWNMTNYQRYDGKLDLLVNNHKHTEKMGLRRAATQIAKIGRVEDKMTHLQIYFDPEKGLSSSVHDLPTKVEKRIDLELFKIIVSGSTPVF